MTTPNVLFIVVDDLGMEQLRMYGRDPSNTYAPTPNIDRLAARGVRFTRAYSMPVCSPTRSCIMTGRFPFRTGIGAIVAKTQQPLLVNETCLPTAIRQGTDNAYRMAAFGKWHLSSFLNKGNNHPNDIGFERYSGAMGNFERGEDDYFSWRIVEDRVSRVCNVYAPLQNVNDAVAWINSTNEPFFCYLPFNTVHDPIHRPPADLYDTSLYVLPNATPVGAESELPYYKAMIQAHDTLIGKLFSEIDASKLANTVVMYFSDNGTAGGLLPPLSGIPANHNKGSVYDPGVNVPLIVAGPGVDLPGRFSNELVNAVDFYYTILEICGANLSQVTAAGTVDSVSFWPIVSNRRGRTARSLGGAKHWAFSEGFAINGPNSASVPPGLKQGFRMITDERYKFHFSWSDLTFPHLAVDVGQTYKDRLYDLQGSIAGPADVNELIDLLDNGDPAGIATTAQDVAGATAFYNTAIATLTSLLT